MSVGRDTSYNLAAAFAPALFGLVVTPFYIHEVGPERYGVLAICWTMIGTLGFASLGMGPSLAYRLATSEDASIERRSSLVWTALILALAASLVGAVCLIGIGKIYFRYFFPATSALDGEIWRALPLLAALLPMATLIGVMNGALQGMRRFGALSAISILGTAMLTIGPLAVAVFADHRLPALILATLVGNVVIATLELAVCGRLLPIQTPTRPKRSLVSELLGYGAWMSATAFIAPLVMLLDRFVIGALRGPTAVAIYVLPYNLVQQLVLLPSSLTSAVTPRLATLPDEEVQQLQTSSLTWLNGLLTPLSVVAIALAAPFLRLWIGPTLGGSASPVAAILLVGVWFHGIGHIPSAVVIGRNRPDLLTRLLLAYFVPYVAILYFATSHFGVIGAAAAWTTRAVFDPILFLYTRPRRSDLWPLVTSALLVLCAMAAALALVWTSAAYWLLMALIIASAFHRNRAVLVSSLGEFHKMALRIS